MTTATKKKQTVAAMEQELRDAKLRIKKFERYFHGMSGTLSIIQMMCHNGEVHYKPGDEKGHKDLLRHIGRMVDECLRTDHDHEGNDKMDNKGISSVEGNTATADRFEDTIEVNGVTMTRPTPVDFDKQGDPLDQQPGDPNAEAPDVMKKASENPLGQKVRLETESGELVHEPSMLTYKTGQPQAVTWGSRFFLLTSEDCGTPVYRETFCPAIVPL